ncbi:unnamed protein product [Brassica rapa subsp. trilocularis]
MTAILLSGTSPALFYDRASTTKKSTQRLTSWKSSEDPSPLTRFVLSRARRVHSLQSPLEGKHHVTEKKEEQPTSINAFELITVSRSLDLGNLFEEEEVCSLDKQSLLA